MSTRKFGNSARRTRMVAPAMVLGLAAMVAGCGGDDDGGTVVAPLRIETSVDTSQLVAGNEIRVTCKAFRGETVDESINSWQLQVTPTDSTVVASDRFSAEKAGTYQVACMVANSSDVDESPIEITVVPAAPSRSVATIDPSTTVAGEPTTVSCSLQDGFGNEISKSDFQPNVTPKDGVTVEGVQVTAEIQGAYQVECLFPGQTVPTETAAWIVQPADGARLIVRLDPEQEAYPLGVEIAVTADMYDQFDNRIAENVTLDAISASPADGWKVDLEASVIEFEAGGQFIITAESGGASGEVSVTVDALKPVIEITLPARGATKDGEQKLTVSGSVSDDIAVKSLEVNGEPVIFDQMTGGFSLDWELGYGVNYLHAVATDDAGNIAESWRSATWSNDWYTLGEDPTTDIVPNGLEIILTQALLDDGDHDPANPDDVATLLEVIVNGLDLEALIPDPLGSVLGCDYAMQEINLKPITASLQLADGKMLIELTIQNFVLKVKNSGGFLCFFNDGGTGPLQYTADELKIDAELSFETQDGVQVPKVEITDVVSEGTFNLDIVIIEDIVDGFFNLVFDIFKGIIGDVLNSVFADLIGQFALDIPFELPALGAGDPNTLVISANPVQFEITPAAFTIGLDAQVTAENPTRPHAVLGSAKYSGCGETLALPEPDKLGWPMLLALHDDVLNQLLFAVWDGGTLNLKLGADDLGDLDLSSFGIANLAVDVDGYVSPYFNSCNASEDVVQLGDLWVDATMDFVGTPTHIAMWIQGGVPISLQAVEGEDGGTEIGFTLGSLDNILIEVVTNEGIFEGNDAAVVDLIKNTLLGSLLDGLLADASSFPLPEINLGELAPGLPENAVLKVDIGNISTEGGTIRVLGGLQ